MSHALAASGGGIDVLEPRQLLSTVYAISDNNTLLEFDSANPQAIVRTVPITGLGAGETMATVAFNPVNERLYGIPSGARTPVYTIDRLSGVATRVGPGVPFGLEVTKATGLAFDAARGYFRYTDDFFGHYRIDPATGLQIGNDAGQEGLSEIAFGPPAGNPAVAEFFGVNYLTNEFMRLDPSRMTVLSSGPLGVDIDRFAGLDFAADGTPYLAVRVNGTARFGTIAADGHTFVEIGVIGDGTQFNIRGLALEPTRQAPTLDAGLSPSFGSIEEDLADPSGLLVRDLIASAGGDLITDASPGALEGIAVTGVNNLPGLWQYSLNGTNWTTIALAADNAAVLLPADDAARLRLVPGLNFSGLVTQALRFRAWDRVVGASGATVNLGGDAIAESISLQSVWASINVLPRRDAPTVTGGAPGSSITLDDVGTARPFQSAVIGYIDSAAQPLITEVTISDPANGTLTAESVAAAGFTLINPALGRYRFTGTAAAATAAIRQLIFKPSEDIAPIGQTTLTLFTITVDDELGIGAQAFSPFVIARSVRDLPTIDAAGAPTAIGDKGTASPFTQVTIGYEEFGSPDVIVDVVLGAGVGELTPESLSASGFALVMGATGTYRFTGQPAAATAAIRQLVFKPNQNLAIPGTATTLAFDIYVSDGVGPQVTAKAPAVEITSENDRPAFTGLTITNRVKFGKSVKPLRRVSISDIDPGQSVTVTVSINTPRKGAMLASAVAASGFIRVGNGRYRFTGLPAEATAAVRTLKFAWSSRLNTALNHTVKVRLTVADASGAQVSNNQTAIILKR